MEGASIVPKKPVPQHLATATRAERHREERAKHAAEAQLNPGKGMNRRFRRMFTRHLAKNAPKIRVTAEGILKVDKPKASKKKKV